ncbi:MULTISPECIES: hypothetical protein [unclassified Caulobacter]|uniref:hypothetical protein n=1 Tax=unclassified Caulobacter TaxID=2648921 RepID=UPI0006F5D03A|nr:MULTISPECIES: hypothetical protein [unclassified Caulobacter]KQV57542.1 hypothetical protein ASC62_14975 [Caulobacter sp. Root342]KQV67114.1 hypothetical protein ASC70_15075 [Caulobacter sp. Root343]
MRRLGLLSPLLLLAACGPGPARQAEICAVQALPARPGVDRFGVPPGVERQAQREGAVYGPGVLLTGRIGWWGRCPGRADTTDMLLIGPAPWALTKGGPRAHGRQVAYGTCYHRREDQRWRTVACRINP